MYLTVKQQIKHLSKEDYKSIKELCHVAKNLTNEAIYIVSASITLQKVHFLSMKKTIFF